MASPTVTPETLQPTTEQKVNEVVQIGGSIAEGFVPSAAPLIAAGVELEPEVFSFIDLLVKLFHKKKVVPKTTA